MHSTTPLVYLVARPALNWKGIHAYLDSVGGDEHWMRIQEGYQGEQHGSKLIELAGRLCYRSWKPGLNANVTRIREDRDEYLANVLNSAHGSVTEHANYSFIIANLSRVATHELVRHRAGWAFSQESMRFVRLDDIGFAEPDIFPDTAEGASLRDQAHQLLGVMEDFQIRAAEVNKLDDPGVDFTRKKTVTSAMRRYAPDGLSTHIMVTANIRALRWVTQMRTDPSAEVEIRNIFGQIGEIMMAEEPALFQDFEVKEDGSWVAKNRKI